MAKDYAKDFYLSVAWKRTRNAFMESKGWLCERCGAEAEIAHHKKYLTPLNIHDPKISLSWDNLEALCMTCHNVEHSADSNAVFFDSAGNINNVKPSKNIQEYEEGLNKLTKLLDNLQKCKTPRV